MEIEFNHRLTSLVEDAQDINPQIYERGVQRFRVRLLGIDFGSCSKEDYCWVESRREEQFEDFIPSQKMKPLFPSRGSLDMDYLLFNSQTGRLEIIRVIRFWDGGGRKKIVSRFSIFDFFSDRCVRV